MVKLGVNIDHVATLRQARKEGIPDVVEAAVVCEKAGADGITVHLREDRRHIQDSDVYNLKRSIKTKLNLEMAATEQMIKIATTLKPQDVCLVPEKRQELTTEGGLDVLGQIDYLKDVVLRLKSAGIRVSVFIDADEKQIIASRRINADCVELHTGVYARSKTPEEKERNLKTLIDASKVVIANGLILNAGHGLNYENVLPVARIDGMNELNIGFSIIARAVFVGLENAVKEMKSLISNL